MWNISACRGSKTPAGRGLSAEWSLKLGEIPVLETTVIFVLGTEQESIFDANLQAGANRLAFCAHHKAATFNPRGPQPR